MKTQLAFLKIQVEILEAIKRIEKNILPQACEVQPIPFVKLFYTEGLKCYIGLRKIVLAWVILPNMKVFYLVSWLMFAVEKELRYFNKLVTHGIFQ